MAQGKYPDCVSWRISQLWILPVLNVKHKRYPPNFFFFIQGSSQLRTGKLWRRSAGQVKHASLLRIWQT